MQPLLTKTPSIIYNSTTVDKKNQTIAWNTITVG